MTQIIARGHLPMRFTLRTLALGIAVIALVLAVGVNWRRATMCELAWLAPGSPEAASLFPITEPKTLSDGSCRFVYYARRRSAGFLVSPQLPINNYTLSVDRETVELVTKEQEPALVALAAIQSRDVRKQGVFVIRGCVHDQKGQPLAHAMVDLMGPFQFVNYFPTRNDGTFTMVLDDGTHATPAGSGYYLRVRAAEETADESIRWNTGSFSLDPTIPEREAVIIVPR